MPLITLRTAVYVQFGLRFSKFDFSLLNLKIKIQSCMSAVVWAPDLSQSDSKGSGLSSPFAADFVCRGIVTKEMLVQSGFQHIPFNWSTENT